jgi:ABC-type transport system involved in cytochrome bd biosynthesis fused ATPase/permease subunit
MQMLEVVELGELVHKLPEGLDTHIGPLGYNFSGGEKQRLKLARVLLRNTPVFILDEPYEFLEAHQVDRLSKKVARILHGKTVLIISHLDLNIESKVMQLAK